MTDEAGGQYATAVECAIGLNVDCGGTEGVHRVRDAVLDVRDREIERLALELKTARGMLDGDSLRTVDEMVATVQQLHAEVDRLREGEEPVTDPRIALSPGQWIWKWNRAAPEKRLQLAEAYMRDAGTAMDCQFQGHAQRLEEGRQAWVALARVRDVVDEMGRITGARHWARILRKAIDGEQRAAERSVEPLAAALSEVLGTFTTARRDDGVIAGHFLEGAIHPDDMNRWRVVLEPTKEQH